MAKRGISKQISRSPSAIDMCSSSCNEANMHQSIQTKKDGDLVKEADRLTVYTPTLLIAPDATRTEMKMPCQNEKNRIPFTQRNLDVGRNGRTLDR
jgi:hypothetical protein